MILEATINPITRKVEFEEEPFSGETDLAVTGVQFTCPNDIGINTDLNDMSICIRYVNARKELFKYYILSKTLVDDAVVFTWTLDEPACRYDGVLYFNVYAEYTDSDKLVKRWNTQISSIEIFKTLEEGDTEPTQENLDEFERLLAQLTDLVNEYESAVAEAESTAVAEAVQAAKEAKEAAEIAMSGTPDGYADLVSDVAAFDARLIEISKHYSQFSESAYKAIDADKWKVFSDQIPTFRKINNIVVVSGSLESIVDISVSNNATVMLMTAPDGFRTYNNIGFRQSLARMSDPRLRGDYFLDFRADGFVYLRWSMVDTGVTTLPAGTVVNVSAIYLCEDADQGGITQNAELVDARICVDGTSFSSTGSHIRGITPLYSEDDDTLYITVGDAKDDPSDTSSKVSNTYSLQREGSNVVLKDASGNSAGSVRLSSLVVEEALADGTDGQVLISNGSGGLDWADLASNPNVIFGNATLPEKLYGRTWTQVASVTLPTEGVWLVTFSFTIDADVVGDIACQVNVGESSAGIRNRQSIFLNGAGQAATANVTVPISATGSTFVPCRIWTNVCNATTTVSSGMWSSVKTMVRAIKIGSVYSYTKPHIFDGAVKGINHRGLSKAAPENTLSAFRLSRKMGFEYVETDISFTSDNVPVLLHDATINRTSNGTGNINKLTYSQVRSYDFGSWFSAKYAGEKIPSFVEFIALCRQLGLKPYIELKSSATYSRAQITGLYSTVKQYAMEKQCTWISFNATYLEYIRDADPTARLGYLVNTKGITDTQINTAKKLKTGSNEVFMDSNSYSNADITKCINAELPLEIWTIDDANTIKNAHGYVSGVTSNVYRAAEVLYEAGGMVSV